MKSYTFSPPPQVMKAIHKRLVCMFSQDLVLFLFFKERTIFGRVEEDLE